MTLTSRTTLNLALVALVAVLALVALYRPGLEVPETPLGLTNLSPAQVSRITIERPGHQTVVLVRHDGQWRMEAPLRAPANRYRIQSLVGLCEVSSTTHYPAADLELGQMGLSPPQITLHLDAQELDFGGTDPLEGRRYVKVGATVYLIADHYHDHLTAPASDFVSPALLPEGEPITELRLAIPAPAAPAPQESSPGQPIGEVRLQLTDGRWQLSPPHPELSADAATALLDEWRHARAAEVRTDRSGPVLGSVWVTLKEEPQPLRFDLLAREPEVVLARPDLGLQYLLPAESGARLLGLVSAPQEQPSEPPQPTN